jgi:hypothetical protein
MRRILPPVQIPEGSRMITANDLPFGADSCVRTENVQPLYDGDRVYYVRGRQAMEIETTLDHCVVDGPLSITSSIGAMLTYSYGVGGKWQRAESGDTPMGVLTRIQDEKVFITLTQGPWELQDRPERRTNAPVSMPQIITEEQKSTTNDWNKLSW